MSVVITRTNPTDDDGSGTTGTIWNAAGKTELYDQIDTALAALQAVNPYTLLRAASGTSTAAGATTVDSIAVSGLTVLDTLIVEMVLTSITQATASPILYSVTDSLTVCPIMAGTGNVNAGGRRIMSARIRQSKDSTTRYQGYTIGHDNGGTVSGEWADNNLTTAFTGSWTMGLRHGGVTAGGTLHWSWSVFKLAGQ